MKYTLQATGFPPVEIEADIHACSVQDADERRSVQVDIFRAGRWLAEVTYLSGWTRERNFTHMAEGETLDELAERVRYIAPDTLPPGAGFPALPVYATRQAHLAAQMQMMTLAALSEALAGARTIEADINAIKLKEGE